jgi:hypothetical protein
MSGWLSHLLVFFVGLVAGRFLALRLGPDAHARQSKKALKNLYRESRGFFDELQKDLDKPEFFQVREFAIVESSQITFVSEDLRFVYYEEDFPDIKSIAKKLDKLGFVDDVAPGKIPIYRMHERLVEGVKEL